MLYNSFNILLILNSVYYMLSHSWSLYARVARRGLLNFFATAARSSDASARIFVSTWNTN